MYWYLVSWETKSMSVESKKFFDFLDSFKFAKEKYRKLKGDGKRVVIEQQFCCGSYLDRTKGTNIVNIKDFV